MNKKNTGVYSPVWVNQEPEFMYRVFDCECDSKKHWIKIDYLKQIPNHYKIKWKCISKSIPMPKDNWKYELPNDVKENLEGELSKI